MRYESIDEDVELKPDLSEDLQSTSASKQSQETSCETVVDGRIDSRDSNEDERANVNSDHDAECRQEAVHVECQSRSDEGHTSDGVSALSGVQKSNKTPEEQTDIQKDVLSLLQIRRGSFKRQQRVLGEELSDVSVRDGPELAEECDTLSVTSQREVTQPLCLESGAAESTHDVKEETQHECAYDSRVPVDDMSPLANLRREEHGLHEFHSFSNTDSEHTRQETLKVEMVQREKPELYLKDEELSGSLNFTKEQTRQECPLKYAMKGQNTDRLQVSSVSAKGDSFEMEEVSIYTILSLLVRSYKEYMYSKMR
jgi:hypothetical protein